MQQGLKEADIIRAANAIAINGAMPTIAAVRKYLGGHGSETTIFNYLSKWKQNLLTYARFENATDLELHPMIALQKNSQVLKTNLQVLIRQLENLANFEQETLLDLAAENNNLRSKLSLIKAELQIMQTSLSTE